MENTQHLLGIPPHHLRIYSSHTCGAMHSHLLVVILAINGFAGKPVLPMIGQFAMHPWTLYTSGSVMSQQPTFPHA
eukprot:m.359334 g.359334  ORF g.359334 m.359334 type:complete len:76 (-) comp28043_c0_seq2:2063-2290(-)